MNACPGPVVEGQSHCPGCRGYYLMANLSMDARKVMLDSWRALLGDPTMTREEYRKLLAWACDVVDDLISPGVEHSPLAQPLDHGMADVAPSRPPIGFDLAARAERGPS